MSGNTGIIQAEISVQIGQALAQLKQASDALAKFGQSAGAGLAPANHAVEGLGKQFKDFRKEQVQEGRLVGFYVREMTDFAGASQATQGAVGGLIQGVMGLATATGPLFAAWAGFEIFKAVAGYFKAAGEEASKAAQEAIDKAIKMQEAVTGLNRALSGLNQLSAAGQQFQTLSRLKASMESWEEEQKTAPAGDQTAANMAAQQREAFERLGGMRELERLAVEMARENAIAAQEEEKKAIAASAERQKEGNKAREEEAKRHAAEMAKIRMADAQARGLADALLFEEIPTAALQKPLDQVVRDAEKNAAEARKKMFDTQDRLGKSSWDAGEMPDMGGDAALRAAAAWREEQAQLKDAPKLWEEIGSSISGAASAFARFGQALGGQAGEMIGNFLGIAEAAIKAAIGMAAAAAAGGPVGWITAIGGMISLAATFATVIGGISARELGGRVGPGDWLVGERGPELLRLGPGASGAVVPSHRLALAGAMAGTSGPVRAGLTFNIHAIDSQSFERSLRSNDSALLRVIRDATRGGA